MARTLLVAIGGVCGCVGRYWMSGAAQRLNGTGFPVGTLSVNLLGSFILGLVMVLSIERGVINANVRTLLTIGFCGGFTTMSTFSFETYALLRDGSTLVALYNIGSTVGGCLAAVWLAAALARWL